MQRKRTERWRKGCRYEAEVAGSQCWTNTQVSDIDEEGEGESETDISRRSSIRGRSVDRRSSRRLSGLSARSLSHGRGDESGRRRSYSDSAPKTPRTPINDILNSHPFEGSPVADQIVQRLTNVIEGNNKFGDVLKNQMNLQKEVYNELGSMKKNIKNEEESIKQYKEQVRSFLVKHVEEHNKKFNETRAVVAEAKSAVEDEILSVKNELSQKINTAKAESSEILAAEIKQSILTAPRDQLTNSLLNATESSRKQTTS